MAVRVWNDDLRRNTYHDFPLAIVATGPSYDRIEKRDLAPFHVFALNAAITEFWDHDGGCTWCCHDLWKIWRHNLRGRIHGYTSWNLVTRRVYLPGKFGNVAWKDRDGSRVTKRFPYRMAESEVQQSQVFWYNELEGEDGYLEAREGVLEIALTVATWWGFSPIVIVGADLAPARSPYAKPWSWKRCAIRPPKFEAMRKALHSNRGCWPEDVYLVESPWARSPFKPMTAAELRRLAYSYER